MGSDDAAAAGPRILGLSRPQWAGLISFVLAGGAVGYLLTKVVLLAPDAGYDLRYLWLAGRLWFEGTSPYGPVFLAEGTARISHGNIPEIWVYPPNFWPIATALGLPSLGAAAIAWNLLGVAMLIGASALIVMPFTRTRAGPDDLRGPFARLMLPNRNARNLLFAAQLFVMAGLEATAITLSVGQTSILIYFGAAVMFHGLATGRNWAVAAGLMLTFLKPHLGIPLALALLIAHRSGLKLVAIATGLSALAALPAFLTDPGVLSAFISAVGSYSDAAIANRPEAMTGLRHMADALTGHDIGGPVAFAATLMIVAALTYAASCRCRNSGKIDEALLCVSLPVAVTVALAPLHYYDFVLHGAVLPALLLSRSLLLAVGVAGLALVLRADQLGKALGLGDPEVAIFEGSLLATLGACAIILPAMNGRTLRA